MHVILADDVAAGLMAFFFLCGGVLAAVLALVALVPASQANRTLTYILAAPAFIWGVFMTLYLLGGFIWTDLRDHDEALPGIIMNLSAFIMPWLLLAGPSLGTSLLAIFVLRRKRAKMEQ